jgi:hypothetical protein
MTRKLILLPAAALLCLGCSGPGGMLGPGASTWWDRTWSRLFPKDPGEAWRDLAPPGPVVPGAIFGGLASVAAPVEEPGARDADKRREAILVLATAKGLRTRPEIHQEFAFCAFNAYEDPSVRVAAMYALRDNAAELTDTQLAALRASLDRSGGRNPKWVRAAAADCLGFYVHEAAAERLLLSLKGDPELDVKLAAIRALGKYPRTEVARTLIEYLPLSSGKPFELSYESRLSLMELTGRTDIGGDRPFDAAAWEKWLAAHPDDAFAKAGELAVRSPRDRPTFGPISATLGVLPNIFRRPAAPDE